MTCDAAVERELSLEAMWHAHGACDFLPQNKVEADPSIRGALLKAKPGVTRDRVMAIMPSEIRATVQLHLDGKIREWHSREDGREVFSS